jgi:hypothetical protein
VRMREKGIAHKIIPGEPEGRCRCRWDVNTKMDVNSTELLTVRSEGMFVPVKGALHGGQVTVPQMRR